jgi:hypothetical protein
VLSDAGLDLHATRTQVHALLGRYQDLESMSQRRLTDGRTLHVRQLAGGSWHLELQPGGMIAGQGELNALLASLLGYRIANEEWPASIDRLANEIEGTFSRAKPDQA